MNILKHICRTGIFIFAISWLNAEIVNTTPTLTSITLESNATTVNIDDTIHLTLKGTYSDGSSGTVDENITYTLNPIENVEVNGSVLRAKKDGNVTVQASIDGANSNTITINITWVVNGYRLPPEPDPKVNNSTLLGVDVNHNGVRDDVERWIYKTYKEYIPCHQELDWNNTVVINGKTIPSAVQVCEDHPVPYHPVVRAVAMQGARAAQIIIQEPKRARETLKIWDNALNCQSAAGHLKDSNCQVSPRYTIAKAIF